MSERPSRYDRYQDPLQVYAEADAETRAVIEKELDRIAELDQREVRLNALGLNYGVVITLAFLAACVYLIATGHGIEGTVLGVMFIIGLVAVIAFGRTTSDLDVPVAQEGRASRASNQLSRSVALGASSRLEAIRSSTASAAGCCAMLNGSRVVRSASDADMAAHRRAGSTPACLPLAYRDTNEE